MKSFLIVVGALALIWIGFNVVTFTVDETQNAVVLQFGEIRQTIEEPGLYFKTPFVQNVIFIEDRLLSVDIQPAPIITSDLQRLTVDSYTLWRIRDSRRYVETMQGIRSNAEQRMDDIVYSLLRDVLGQKNFAEALLRDFLTDVTQRAKDQVQDFGIDIIDVRIKRADLPEENEQAVFARMISERQQKAELFRAQGEQEALAVRSKADQDIEIIIAEGNKEGEQLKGEGDAQALEIYANAYNQDEEFFLFWRTLDSYKKTLAANSTLLLSSNAQYLRLFDVMNPSALKEALDNR